MAKLSFAIALNLITDGFKRGTQDVKSGMASIKSAAMSTAAYFGIGFAGVGAIFSKLKDAAVDFAKAQKQLNVNSGGAIAGLQNMQMLKKVAKDTGQEITSLMSTYAKFTATATANGYAVSEQQKIFQNVSKAVKGYKLTDDEQAIVMGSLNRMMNQGQVSTKNFTNTMLRAMPQAKTAMAAALGVGVDKLTAVIKKGADAKKVLGTFAENLGKQAPSVDLNTLSGQQARRQNAFTDLANSSGVVTALMKINKVAADVMEYIRNNAKSLITEIVGLIAGIKIASFWNQWKVYSEASSAAMISNATRAHTQVRLLDRQTTVLKKQIATQEAALSSASADERLAIEVQLQAKKDALKAKELETTKAKNVAQVADERAAAVQSGTAWEATWAKMKTSAEGLGVRLKAVWSTVGPMLLITIITELAMRLYTVFQQLGSIKKEWEEYKNGAREAIHTQEIGQLENMRDLVTQRGASEKQVKGVMDDINKRYGTHIKNEKELINWINKRAEALRNTAMAEYATRKQVEYQSKLDEIYARHGGSQKGLDKDLKTQGGSIKDVAKYMFGWAVGEHSTVTDYKDAARLSQLVSKSQKDAQKYIGLSVSTNEGMSYSGYSGNPGKVKKDPAQTELESAEKQYTKSLLEIAAKEKLGMITATEATKARQELVISTYAQVETSKYDKVKKSSFAKDLGKKYTEVQSARAVTQLSAYEEDYNKKLKDLSAQYDAGAITQEEYGKALMDLIASAKKEVATFNNIPGANKAYTEALMGFVTGLGSQESAVHYDSSKQTGSTKAYERDTTYDYKKEYVDILSEEYDKAQEKLEALKSGSLKLIGNLQEQINSQLANVTSLSEALKIAELKKDIKDLKKDLQGDILNTVSSIADGSNRVYEAWAQLGETMRNSDASAWEKIYAVWQAISESVNSILSVIDALKQWKTTDEQLRGAEQQLSAQHTLSTAQKVAENQIGMTSDALAETATKGKAVSDVQSNTASAASSAAAGAAKMPFPFNLIAIAGAIGAVLALMASIPKFADGGVMSGSAISGDLNLARVNSGEMLLNGTQQKTLFDAINKNNLNGGGGYNTITTKFRGSDLYIVLSNYLKKTGKSL